MRNKNVWIILGVVVLIALVGVLSLVIKPELTDVSDESIVTETSAPQATSTDLQPEPQSYLLVTVGGVTYQPLGLHTEGVFSLSQGEDGTVVNTVHVTPTSVWMESSTCDNQDCVEQGVVALETMNDRVLGNMIICLPHQVTLQLYTVEEMNALIASLEEEAND